MPIICDQFKLFCVKSDTSLIGLTFIAFDCIKLKKNENTEFICGTKIGE